MTPHRGRFLLKAPGSAGTKATSENEEPPELVVLWASEKKQKNNRPFLAVGQKEKTHFSGPQVASLVYFSEFTFEGF